VNDGEVHFNRCYITTTLVPDGEVTTCFHLRLMELISMVEANQSSYEMFDHLFSFLRKHF
jgi:hypothetical protein